MQSRLLYVCTRFLNVHNMLVWYVISVNKHDQASLYNWQWKKYICLPFSIIGSTGSNFVGLKTTTMHCAWVNELSSQCMVLAHFGQEMDKVKDSLIQKANKVGLWSSRPETWDPTDPKQNCLARPDLIFPWKDPTWPENMLWLDGSSRVGKTSSFFSFS